MLSDAPILEEIKQEGKREGKREEARNLLLNLIASKFGKAPKDIREKVLEMTSTSELEKIAVALLTAQSIEELRKLFD